MTAKDVTENIYSGLEFAVLKLKDEWESVHSIHLKTESSSATPIYSKNENAALEYVKMNIEKTKNENSSSSRTSSSRRSSKKSAPSSNSAVKQTNPVTRSASASASALV